MLRHAIAGCVLVLLSLAGHSVLAQPASSVELFQPQPAEHAASLTLSGQVSAGQNSSLSPRLSGLVERLEVDAGSRVRQGDQLLKLDDQLARLELASSEAALQAAEARLGDAQRVAKESSTLAGQGLLPASQGEAAQAALAVAAAEARARRAETALWRERLNRHWLTAPFDGVIVERRVDVGEWVEASTPALQLLALDRLRFDAQVPQEWFGRIDHQRPVIVRIDGRDEPIADARIEAEVAAGDPATRAFLLRVALPALDPPLLPGASGRVQLALDQGQTAWSVPRDALVRFPDGGYSLWLAVAENGGMVARSRRISVDDRLTDPALVIDGLSGTESIILRGFQRLRDGDPVQPASGD